MATRHLSRSILFQSLYEWDFYRTKLNKNVDLMAIIDRNMKDVMPLIDEPDFIYRLTKNLIDHFDEINNIIEKTAPEWPIDQISLTDRNILRLGLAELMFAPKNEVPPKVAINEAIELAKNFGTESSSKFINGVLGTVYRQMVEEGIIKESDKKDKSDDLKENNSEKIEIENK
ncbi:MAG TPA: transcription antitermination factor NusB [Candidatus Paceibacterota bacterium]|jgi:N utilization substance protein B|nr:transcription antitermination factor NusB [Parcubacteria group bacterium]HOM33318.1 transcription antitermination factor NusB [Candidatus Paceibacterota bacterium]HPC37460.1 transcription antitermination factor NusB [Candidatus Paceibacterota bacterium]HRU36074.1 transcription antitermination factor NusB [Candidatus Paceibacterota bacterium]